MRRERGGGPGACFLRSVTQLNGPIRLKGTKIPDFPEVLLFYLTLWDFNPAPGGLTRPEGALTQLHPPRHQTYQDYKCIHFQYLYGVMITVCYYSFQTE